MKLHHYCISVRYLIDYNNQGYTSWYIGIKTKRITKKIIKEVIESTIQSHPGLSTNNVVITSISYLGEMTEEEFNDE